MIRTDRLCVWILMFGFALFIPAQHLFQYVDEICVMLLGGVALADAMINCNWRRYSLLWLFMVIQTFYAIYSVTAVHFNTTPYIILDWILGLKPYVPFLVIYAVKPVFSESDKRFFRTVAVANASLCILFLIFRSSIPYTVGHVMSCGTVIMVSMLMYLICAVDQGGSLSRHRMILLVSLLTAGLYCTRSKYYGEYIIVLFLIFLYKPGMFSRITARHLVTFGMIVGIIILATWQKINYYFISGAMQDSASGDALESFARPVLYLTSGLIFIDYFPFGSGLASFASYPSSANYSTLYYDYGINMVWGLSPTMPDFICDAYYPQLAQYGLIGVALFLTFFVYLIKRFSKLIESNPSRQHYMFCAGIAAISFIMIENIASTVFVQSAGFMAMSIIALTLSNACIPADDDCIRLRDLPQPNPLQFRTI